MPFHKELRDGWSYISFEPSVPTQVTYWALPDKEPCGNPPDQIQLLSMPPNGNSERIKIPIGYHMHDEGTGYIMHCVYTDGEDSKACTRGDGPILYVYLQNLTDKPNTARYEFIKSAVSPPIR
jgi:hypothetical protein